LKVEKGSTAAVSGMGRARWRIGTRLGGRAIQVRGLAPGQRRPHDLGRRHFLCVATATQPTLTLENAAATIAIPMTPPSRLPLALMRGGNSSGATMILVRPRPSGDLERTLLAPNGRRRYTAALVCAPGLEGHARPRLLACAHRG
jgi:hypothetical protein